VPTHGRVDRRVATTEPALLLSLRGERLPLLREGLALLRIGLALLEGLLVVRRLRRLTVLLLSRLTRLDRLTWLAAVPLARLRLARLRLARLRLARLLRGLLCWLLGRLGVLGELLRGRPVTARLTWVGVLRRLGRGCGHGRFL
jgi:hypothetical protein